MNGFSGKNENQAYRLIANEAPVSIMCFAQDGMITFVNKWHLKVFACNKHDAAYFLGIKIWQLPGVKSAGLADGLKRILEGQSLALEDVYVSRFSGGQSGYINLRGMPIWEDGKVLGGVLIREDVTTKKQAELALKESLDKQTALLRSLPVGVITVDPGFKTIGLNQQGHEITGFSQTEAAGRFCGDLLQSDACGSGCPIKSALKSRSPIGPIDTTVQSKRRGRIPVRLWAAGVYDNHKKPLGGVAVFQDVSEIKALERERANIVSMFAHDMKSPLVGIRGFAQRMLRQKAELETDKGRKYLEIISRESGRLEKIVTEFLDFTRLESGQLKLNFTETGLEQELLELHEAFQPRFAQAGIELKIQNSTGLPLFEADPLHLRRGLGNLLENALKYSSSGSRVTLAAYTAGKEIVIEIEDQGRGIPPDELPHIFEVFYRGSGQNRQKGHGLGLAGTEAIVKAHGGRIKAASRLGQGTTFTINLPLDRQAEASTKRQGSTPKRQAG
jgi:PAS domain S-box-containing protein